MGQSAKTDLHYYCELCEKEIERNICPQHGLDFVLLLAPGERKGDWHFDTTAEIIEEKVIRPPKMGLGFDEDDDEEGTDFFSSSFLSKIKGKKILKNLHRAFQDFFSEKSEVHQ
ncbi:MAG TPA: hypothetical protein PKV71_15780 [Calditrichia bacterium]|nr:hypothetical protein [Calditrichota bacterium]HQU74668.1 hypothetical protein [Calditrichia bacterium]HQV33348.1 hypothetical protein [Calditrichia bacterium]